ncbi:recombinase family protein [Virgibacillus dakarensis]|uniref:recombinase family protein n=1 Tax=Virgibacillus dakarensis TaxID=1917889 RepID=UPI000B44D9E5|nr:recombinase family protein [Virgibacillus dakarensis]
MAVYGYMRISTNKEEQKFDRQESQLLEHGVSKDNIYADRISGSQKSRPALDKLLADLHEGDTVLILSIDRLSRSVKDLLKLVEIIKEKGASLKSIQDSWLDTSGNNIMSDFLLQIFGALAEMERKQIVKRVNEGIAVAKKKGVKFGRPTANKNKVAYAIELYHKGEHTTKQIADICGISRRTLYNYLSKRKY